MGEDTRRGWLLAVAAASLLSCSVARVRLAPAAFQADANGTHDPVPACVTGDSLLDSPAMRDLMRLLWDHSRADAPPEERRERGGFLFDSAGVVVYRADLDHPRDTPCRSYVIVPHCGEPIAAVSTHPFRPGESLPASCHPGGPAGCEYTVERFGGASALDLEAFDGWRVPGYIVDKEYVYVIPRGTTQDNARTLTKRYPRSDRAAHCRII